MAKLDLQADTVESVSVKKKKASKVESVPETTNVEQISEAEVEEETETEAVADETPKATEEIQKEDTVTPETPEKKSEEATEKKPAAKKKRKKISEMTPIEQITLRAQRGPFAVQKASKDKEKVLYKNEKIFVEDGDVIIPETDATQRKEEWLELVASSKDARILSGTIVSITEVETDQDKDDPKYIPDYMAKVRFKSGQFNVNIPSFVLYYYNYKDLNRAMALDIGKNMQRRLGAEVDFVVRYADEATGTVIGDRLAALSMRGVRYYTSIDGRKPRVIPGMIVQAKIIAIARDYITVDAAGAEMRIPIEEISWLYQADARNFDGIKTRECYQVGERVNVKILTAEPEKVRVRNSNYTLINATASIKQAMPNPRNKYFDEFKPGDIYAGIITGITESGVYVNLDQRMDCLCKFPKSGHRFPIMGEQAVVRVNSKDEEKKFIYGTLR